MNLDSLFRFIVLVLLTMEVPSPISGKLQEIIIKEGQTVSVDALLAILSKEDTSQENDINKEIENTQVQEKTDFKEKDTEDNIQYPLTPEPESTSL